MERWSATMRVRLTRSTEFAKMEDGIWLFIDLPFIGIACNFGVNLLQILLKYLASFGIEKLSNRQILRALARFKYLYS